MWIYVLQGGTNVTMKINAPRGDFSVNETTQQLEVNLYDARSLTWGGTEWFATSYGRWTSPPLKFNTGQHGKDTVSLSDMTFPQLRAELREMEQRVGQVGPGPDGTPLSAVAQTRDFLTPLRVQLNRQWAFSLACFGFTLVGIPLGIRLHRRETNIGIAVALVLVVVYYSLVVLAAHLDTRPELKPQLLVWIPNFLFDAVGAVLLARANRGV